MDLHLCKQTNYPKIATYLCWPFVSFLPDSYIICLTFCSFSSDNATILDAFVLDHCFNPTTRELPIHFENSIELQFFCQATKTQESVVVFMSTTHWPDGPVVSLLISLNLLNISFEISYMIHIWLSAIDSLAVSF